MTTNDILIRLKAATGPMTKWEAQGIADLLPESAGLDYALLVMAMQGGYENVGAALALVERMLPGCIGDLHWGAERSTACILRQDGSRPYFSGETPALAILTALFSALAAKEIDNADEH